MRIWFDGNRDKVSIAPFTRQGHSSNTSSSVIPWLDHGIHAIAVRHDGPRSRHGNCMDCRIEPCNDVVRGAANSDRKN
ncbi:hypothetical protein LAL4801_02474 [Roseibium aggregatum]|uniref:Uncharacterized protein n=1 Tax=Roseibium aggregatum TaxID=187304 RepID=A0A0M6Y1Q9_9HYPH|nr:hypothetical protein LAL4801_02474 [Roseibium aggregatum]